MDLSATIKKYRELRGLSVPQLAKLTGINKQSIYKWEEGVYNPSEDNLDLLSQALGITFTPRGVDDSESKKGPSEEKLIPFYDTMAVGGHEIVTDDTVMANDFEMIRPGHFFGKATGALRLFGDSMYEKYPSGCIIAYREFEDWRDGFIHFGEDYVIETLDGRRVVKNVQPSDKEGHYLAVSHNTWKNKHGIDIYKPYPIPIKKIRRMAFVMGIIKFESSI